MTRDALRRKLQQTRAQLSEASRRHAAEAVATRVLRRLQTAPGGTVAVFKSFGAELDTAPTLQALWQRDLDTVLPVLHPFSAGNLLFLRYSADTVMRKNKYGIAEPQLECRQIVPLAQIDWLLMPLVGFDSQGNRLGMGGGYYDRTLAQWRRGLLPNLKPIGLAYDEQQVQHIPTEPWDVAIPEVITPSKHWQF